MCVFGVFFVLCSSYYAHECFLFCFFSCGFFICSSQKLKLFSLNTSFTLQKSQFICVCRWMKEVFWDISVTQSTILFFGYMFVSPTTEENTEVPFPNCNNLVMLMWLTTHTHTQGKQITSTQSSSFNISPFLSLWRRLTNQNWVESEITESISHPILMFTRLS